MQPLSAAVLLVAVETSKQLARNAAHHSTAVPTCRNRLAACRSGRRTADTWACAPRMAVSTELRCVTCGTQHSTTQKTALQRIADSSRYFCMCTIAFIVFNSRRLLVVPYLSKHCVALSGMRHTGAVSITNACCPSTRWHGTTYDHPREDGTVLYSPSVNHDTVNHTSRCQFNPTPTPNQTQNPHPNHNPPKPAPAAAAASPEFC